MIGKNEAFRLRSGRRWGIDPDGLTFIRTSETENLPNERLAVNTKPLRLGRRGAARNLSPCW
jgi:hypothetical protein